MAQPLCAPLAQSWIPGPARRPPMVPSDRDSVCSPGWHSDSWDGAQTGSPTPPCARPARRAGTPGRRGTHSSRLGSGQRQSASEREKLRMRTLARALHELRRFLPPSVAPAGQSLTKIETLRLAIRYIGHLSAVLGLSEDSLRRQRHAGAASPRGCPLCPDGGPAQAQSLGLHLSPAACSRVSWGSPPACPGPRVVAESWDPSFLYAETETASLERQEMEPSHSSPLFSSDVLALLETWTPQEWPPA
ncbi:mesoderm posterior protein 1 [Peromyscus eremicus]|uniref:mesoderm posterior protein 1 n=1 Tax=Peromyscus eremicus TaxID=42410 RepID=UPI0027DE7081|nr:mesoderm posterior protein 1 [Peromyscus eremicus]